MVTITGRAQAPVFRHGVGEPTADRQGVSRIIIGELTGIRSDNSKHGRHGNAMVHNYWSHKYVADTLTWTAGEYGINVETISEAYTSQICPRCGSRNTVRILPDLKCLDCGLEAHRDAVGVVNMAARCGGYAVRPMVWPMLIFVLRQIGHVDPLRQMG